MYVQVLTKHCAEEFFKSDFKQAPIVNTSVSKNAAL